MPICSITGILPRCLWVIPAPCFWVVICALAFALDMPLILIPVGLVYIVETLSVIMQVGYFKLTHGKRIFKMAPIHHHFEMCGWKEVKIVLIFSAVSAVMCVLAWIGISGLI